MKEPIFVFTDDVDIFRTIKDATSWLESWIVDKNFRAFDASGALLNPRIEKSEQTRFLGLIRYTHERVLLEESGKILPEELKTRLIQELRRRRAQIPSIDLQILDNMNFAEALEKCISAIGYTSEPKRPKKP